MDIRRREAELFLLRYDGEETEAISHLRHVSEKLDEAMEDVAALKNAAKDLLNSALAEGESNGTLGISAAALIKYREAMK